MGDFALTAQGRRLYVDPSDTRARHLIEAAGDFNPGSLALWRRAVSAHAWDVVVDVGVNYGEMLVGVELPPDADVIGFEPNVSMHPLITRTCRELGIDLDLRAEAVSDRCGSATFVVDRVWSGTSSLQGHGAHDLAGDAHGAGRWRHVEVETTTLDEVVGTGRSWCAKVDVEGSEPAVLAGAARAMAGDSAWALMLELLHHSPAFLAELAGDHAVFLLDRRTHGLVRVPGRSRSLAERMLACGWLYPQDGLVTSRDVADALAAA